MRRFLTLDDIEIENKVVLVRVDFNSAIDPNNKKILDDTRIRAHGKTTINELSEKGAKVVVLAHQGRKGGPDFMSLKQHSELLSRILSKPVKFVNGVFDKAAKNSIESLESGEILILENVRTYADETKKGTAEEQSKTELVKNLAPLAEFFVNDAFSTAHRAHASIVGFAHVLPSAAGRIMESEVRSLTKILENPEKPVVFILGGAKADDSLDISRYVLEKNIADHVLTGGVVGHVFLTAKNLDLGKPNKDLLRRKGLMDLLPGIKELFSKYPSRIEIPEDIAVDMNGRRREIPIGELPTDWPIFDIGAKTVENYTRIIADSKSIVISGPMGVFEKTEFGFGTKRILKAIAESEAFSLAGGGHTIAAIDEYHLNEEISYVSTAGGALTEFLMGKKLPGVVVLEKAATRKT